MKRPTACALALVAAALIGCGSSDPTIPDGAGRDVIQVADATPDVADASVAADADAGPPAAIVIEAEPQRPGDADRGYAALMNTAFVTCGIPRSLYDQYVAPQVQGGTGLPGREGKNAELPYVFTSHVTPEGVEVITPNCLGCHAGGAPGKNATAGLVIGLGNAASDFTTNLAPFAQAAPLLISDPVERMVTEKWAARLNAISPYTTTSTVGVNPADNLAAILFAHRDAETLAWSDEALLEPPPEIVVPVDVPPWWRMKKKHAMFYTAAGRGDHARIMVTASTLCTDTVEEARTIDSFAADLRAYIESIEPPKYPFPIDAALAQNGKQVFEATCSRCHGTYGEGGTYPNKLISVFEVGTDETLALGASQFADRFLDWFARSFYGEMSRLEPEAGYVAPPLDGIWATAPFLHNGSVPTLATLLDSTKRPAFFKRTFDPRDFDPVAVGPTYQALTENAETDPMKRKLIYDTTQLGYSNKGHTFGDKLSEADRAAVIEYLKSL